MDGLKVVKRVLPILGLIILIFFIISLRNTNFEEVLAKIDISLLLFLIGITVIDILLKAWRWKLLVQGASQQIISLPFSFLSIIAGIAAGSFIPGKVEMAKPLLLKTEKNIPFSQSFSALFLERVCDFLAIMGFLLISIAVLPQQQFMDRTIMIILSVLFISGLLSIIFFPKPFVHLAKIICGRVLPSRFAEKTNHFSDQFVQSFSTFKQKIVFVLLLLSFAANGLEMYRLQYLLHSFSVEATFLTAAFAIALAVIVGILSFIPGGVGITEFTLAGMLTLLLPLAAVPSIKSAVLIERVFAYYLLIVIGAIILIFYKRTLKAEDKSI